LTLTEIATPHIAGYSKDGKAIGTQMSVHALVNSSDLGWKVGGLQEWSNLKTRF